MFSGSEVARVECAAEGAGARGVGLGGGARGSGDGGNRIQQLVRFGSTYLARFMALLISTPYESDSPAAMARSVGEVPLARMSAACLTPKRWIMTTDSPFGASRYILPSVSASSVAFMVRSLPENLRRWSGISPESGASAPLSVRDRTEAIARGSKGRAPAG